jgi:hypothetical protein
VAAATVGGLSAVWFFGLQALHLDAWCRWCTATHAMGLTALGLTVASLWRRGVEPSAIAAGALVAVTLVVGQVAMSDTRGSVLSFGGQQGGALTLPTLGDAEAAEARVLYVMDYTCPRCRQVHPVLQELLPTYDGRLAIAVAVLPLDSNCNPTVEHTHEIAEDACELARLSLAVWNLRPDQFSNYHAYLMTGPRPPSVAEATAQAQRLVGEHELREALADDVINRQIAAHVGLWRGLNETAGPLGLPVLQAGPQLSSGVVDRRALAELLDQHLAAANPTAGAEEVPGSPPGQLPGGGRLGRRCRPLNA